MREYDKISGIGGVTPYACYATVNGPAPKAWCYLDYCEWQALGLHWTRAREGKSPFYLSMQGQLFA